MELLAEPCAINSFDIDRENPSVSENCINMGWTLWKGKQVRLFYLFPQPSHLKFCDGSMFGYTGHDM